jgi:uncharacterized repeat protein (TIGR01451 family)
MSKSFRPQSRRRFQSWSCRRPPLVEPLEFRRLLSGAAGHSEPWPEIALNPVAGGFASPVYVANAGDGSDRLFVVEQEGRIRIVSAGQVLNTPFLDIGDRVSCCGEQGLLSVAFPPNYAQKQYFYVDYTDVNGDTVVARFRVTADANLADPTTEEILLQVDQPFDNHNGGLVLFGPDGFLYVGLGDGGSGGDPLNAGQDTDTLLGKILRIDVESGTVPYAIPPGNPFVNQAGFRDEIWALGLRNPWRFSFDRATGDLYIGDVGQGSWEEVDFQPAASPGGENYGWRILEGAHCFRTATCNQSGLVLPVAEYDHDQGCSITGGLVSRAADAPQLDGIYFYGDFCSGNLWGLRRHDTFENMLLLNTPRGISSFGADEAGHVLLVDYFAGDILRIDDAAPPAIVDLMTGVTEPAEPATFGMDLTYTIALSNGGPDAAPGVNVRAAIPAGAGFVSATPSQGSCLVGRSLRCELGSIAAEGNATVAVVVRPSAAGQITLDTTATATAFDSNTADNMATVQTTVQAAIEFSLPTFAVLENAGSATITVLRRGGTSGAAEVTFTTGDDTAIAGTDYTPRVTTLQFAPGESSRTVAVAILDNATPDSDRALDVTLRNAVGSVGFGLLAQAKLRIVDNDGSRGGLRGLVFDDLNGNGTRETGEPGIRGALAFLDANANGRPDLGERLAVSRATGRYRFDNLPAGDYTIALSPPDGFVADPRVMAAVAAGEMTSGVRLSAYRPASIKGVVYHDHERNGVRDAGDSPLDDYTIYLDLDRDGAPDVEEPVTTSRTNGKYVFKNLRPGSYRVAQVLANGVEQVTPANLIQQEVTVTSGGVGRLNFGNELPEGGAAGARRRPAAPAATGSLAVPRRDVELAALDIVMAEWADGQA